MVSNTYDSSLPVDLPAYPPVRLWVPPGGKQRRNVGARVRPGTTTSFAYYQAGDPASAFDASGTKSIVDSEYDT